MNVADLCGRVVRAIHRRGDVICGNVFGVWAFVLHDGFALLDQQKRGSEVMRMLGVANSRPTIALANRKLRRPRSESSSRFTWPEELQAKANPRPSLKRDWNLNSKRLNDVDWDDMTASECLVDLMGAVLSEPSPD